jgi:hypothetical protein
MNIEGAGQQIKTIYIKPGAPWENGHIESFHDKLRDECLNRELFGALAEARVILESWRVEYNDLRPHSSPGYLRPSQYQKKVTNESNGGCAPPKPRAARRGRRSAGQRCYRTTVANKPNKETNGRTLVLKCPTCGVRSKMPVNIHIDYRILKKQQVHITLHFLSEQGEVVFTSGCRRGKGWQECPDTGDYKLVCQILAYLLNEKEYFLKILMVENGSKVVCQAEDVVSLDVKDLEARSIGDYHVREPGLISPLLNWRLLPNKY